MLRRSLLLAAALSVVAGCRSGESNPQRRTLIDSRDRYDPRSLDPALSTDVPTGRAVSYLFDGLTRFTADAKLEPGLAERWEVSPDGRVYTFYLRRGVHFQNGTPLRASQVVRSFERVLNPATKGGRGWPLYPIAGARAYADGKARAISGLAAPDDSTLRITLDTALAIFPKLLAMPVASIVPDSTPADFGEHPVGTGPWKLAEWKHDDYILLAKNPSYWGGAAKTDSLMVRIIPESSTAVAEFESGNVDLLYVPEAETQRWERTDEKKALLMSAPALRLWYVAINTTRGPLKDARVRQALNYAVDVQSLIDTLFHGLGTRQASPILANALGFDPTVTPYEYNPDLARQLLADAGYPNGLDVTLNVYDTQKLASDVLSEQLKQVGIRVTEEVLDQPTFIGRVVQNQGINFALHCCVRQPDPDIILSDMFSPKLRGAIYISHADLEADLAAARKELDTTKRAQLYADLQKKIMQDVLEVPLAMVQDRSVHISSLKGMPTLEALWGLDLTRLYFQ
jgi:peptide/nickel transport system substrate-binding protein/oligopeptide transport system substrate-binding protein